MADLTPLVRASMHAFEERRTATLAALREKKLAAIPSQLPWTETEGGVLIVDTYQNAQTALATLAEVGYSPDLQPDPSNVSLGNYVGVIVNHNAVGEDPSAYLQVAFDSIRGKVPFAYVSRPGLETIEASFANGRRLEGYDLFDLSVQDEGTSDAVREQVAATVRGAGNVTKLLNPTFAEDLQQSIIGYIRSPDTDLTNLGEGITAIIKGHPDLKALDRLYRI